MKVVFCMNDGYNCINGINAWLVRLLPDLKNRGIDIKVFFIAWSPVDQCTTIPILKKMGIDCIEISTSQYTESRVKWILKKLREDPPDIFVANHIVPALYASRWIKEAGVPTIGVIHNDDNIYEAILNEFVFCKSYYKLSATVAVSKSLQQSIHQRNIGNTILERIPCGAPIPNNMTKEPKEILRLVYVGRLVDEQKRIIDTTKALCRAVKEIPNTEAFLYGSGSEHDSVELVLNQEGKDLPIYLMGLINSDEMQKHLLKYHVIVLLSDYEGIPVSLIESMACGLVPICTKIESGIPELITHNVNGLLVIDRGDDFVAAVKRLHDEPNLWKNLSQLARAKVESDYSHDICVGKWERLFENIHQSHIPKKPISIPNILNLPPLNVHLDYDDHREPTIMRKAYSKLKMFFGRR